MDKKEYIERDYILRTFASMNYPWMDFEDAYDIVQNTPAADVVEVVRCKDCAFFRADEHICMRHVSLVYGNAFCNFGERKDQK